jgi:hemerythrin
MSDFIWKDHYLIGNQKVDQQHQQLFDLANKLVQSKTQDDLAENAMLLYRHVREHFQVEETVMKNYAYPDYQNHVDTHNLMLNKLVEVSDKINKHEWRQQDVLKFMQEWISHILEDDSAFSEYFQAHPDRQAIDA